MFAFLTKYRPIIATAFAAVVVLTGCFQETGFSPNEGDNKAGMATVDVKMRLSSVNALRKGSAISLNKMVVIFVSTASDTVRDTVTTGTSPALGTNPSSPQNIAKAYTLKALRGWKVYVTVKDTKDSVTHSDSASTPVLYAADQVSINLGTLTPRYAMYEAKFLTLPDSVSSATGNLKQQIRFKRLVLKVDGTVVRDTTLSYFAAGSTPSLAFDYVATNPWATISSGTSKNLNAVHFTSDTGYIAGDTIAYKTVDGGITWSTMSGLPGKKAGSVSFLNGQTGYIGTDSGYFVKTTNGGANWTKTAGSLAGASAVSPLFYVGADTSYALQPSVSGTRVERSIGGGAWGVVSTPTFTFMAYGLSCVNATNCWAVGAGGNIRRTTGAGTFGIGQTSGTTKALRAVHFTSVNAGTAVGDTGAIVRTTNGGTTWNVQASGTTKNLKAVFFKDSANGFAAGEGGVMLVTTNGGTTWTAQNSGTTRNINSLQGMNGIVYAVGDGGVILRSGGHLIEMVAYGVFGSWPEALPLYRGSVNVNVAAGSDATIPMTLAWVGPTGGGGNLSVTLGKVGKVTVNGLLPGTTL